MQMQNSKQYKKDSFLSFYETTYLTNNPSLSIEDCEIKFNQLMKVLDNIEVSGVMLDIGCGSGNLLDKMKKHLSMKYAIGVDISINTLQRAKQLSPSNDYVRANGEYLPFKESSIELALMQDIFEHVPHPIELLNEVKIISKNILLSIPLESSILSDIALKIAQLQGKRTNKEIYGHIHRFNSRECMLFLEKSNLNVRKTVIIKSPFSEYSSFFGKIYLFFSKTTNTLLSEKIHEKFFGGYTFIALCSGVDLYET